MYWKTMSDFWHMGGYGLYVWLSFGVTFACIIIELIMLRMRRIQNEKAKALL